MFNDLRALNKRLTTQKTLDRLFVTCSLPLSPESPFLEVTFTVADIVTGRINGSVQKARATFSAHSSLAPSST